MNSLQEYTSAVASNARDAATALSSVSGAAKQVWLLRVADELIRSTESIAEANQLDLVQGAADGLSEAMLDRLKLTPERIVTLAGAVREIAALPDPIGEVIEGSRGPNGLQIQKIRVPLGVVFFIY